MTQLVQEPDQAIYSFRLEIQPWLDLSFPRQRLSFHLAMPISLYAQSKKQVSEYMNLVLINGKNETNQCCNFFLL